MAANIDIGGQGSVGCRAWPAPRCQSICQTKFRMRSAFLFRMLRKQLRPRCAKRNQCILPNTSLCKTISGRSEQTETSRRRPSILHTAVARTCAWAQCPGELFHRNSNWAATSKQVHPHPATGRRKHATICTDTFQINSRADVAEDAGPWPSYRCSTTFARIAWDRTARARTKPSSCMRLWIYVYIYMCTNLYHSASMPWVGCFINWFALQSRTALQHTLMPTIAYINILRSTRQKITKNSHRYIWYYGGSECIKIISKPRYLFFTNKSAE